MFERFSSFLVVVALLIQVGFSSYTMSRVQSLEEKLDNIGKPPPDTAPLVVDNVSADDDPSLGPSDAPITVVEFSDYQCPFCKQAQASIDAMLKMYPKQVRFVIRDFPLEEIHPYAFNAALVANCVGQQGKYWEMHNKLFEHQDTLDKASEYAADMGIDRSKFDSCINDSKSADEIRHDMEDGKEYQVSATPTFFINGHRLVGPTQEMLLDAVKSMLN